MPNISLPPQKKLTPKTYMVTFHLLKSLFGFKLLARKGSFLWPIKIYDIQLGSNPKRIDHQITPKITASLPELHAKYFGEIFPNINKHPTGNEGER